METLWVTVMIRFEHATLPLLFSCVAEVFFFQNVWPPPPLRCNVSWFSFSFLFLYGNSFIFIYHGLHISYQLFIALCFILHFTVNVLYLGIPTRKIASWTIWNLCSLMSRWWACCKQIGRYLSLRFAENHTHSWCTSEIPALTVLHYCWKNYPEKTTTKKNCSM